MIIVLPLCIDEVRVLQTMKLGKAQAFAFDNAGNEGKSNIVQDLGLFIDSQPTPTPNEMLSVQQHLLQQR